MSIHIYIAKRLMGISVLNATINDKGIVWNQKMEWKLCIVLEPNRFVYKWKDNLLNQLTNLLLWLGELGWTGTPPAHYCWFGYLKIYGKLYSHVSHTL